MATQNSVSVELGEITHPTGQWSKGAPLTWREQTMINPHFVITGASGSGKTTTVKRLINDLAPNFSGRIHVVDSHRDLIFPEEISSRVEFHVNSTYGLNPLEITPNPEDGGPLVKIEDFISLLRRCTGSIGHKQEAVLRNLLLDVYALHRFYPNSSRSWDVNYDPGSSEKRYAKTMPTLADVNRFAEYKMKSIKLGVPNSPIKLLEKYADRIRELQRAANRAEVDATVELQPFKEAALNAFVEAINSFETGRELDDLRKYESYDVLKSVSDRIANLTANGTFKDIRPPFDPAKKIWIYDIKGLTEVAAAIFVDTLARTVFTEAKNAGLTEIMRCLLVIDEAAQFTSSGRSHILNKIQREGRKFGLAQALIDQSPAGFPSDILDSAGTIILLGIAPANQLATARKLSIDIARIVEIKPPKTALVQIWERGKQAAFYPVRLKEAA